MNAAEPVRDLADKSETWFRVDASLGIAFIQPMRGSHFRFVLSQATTLSIAAPSQTYIARGWRILLRVEQDATGGRTLTADGSTTGTLGIDTTASAVTFVELAWDEVGKVWQALTYVTSATLTAAIATHEAASNPHPTYLTAAEGDAAYQPLDATLTAFAGLTIAANSISVGTGADAFVQLTLGANTIPGRSSAGNILAKSCTDFGFSLLDDADAATARETLGAIIHVRVVTGDTNLVANEATVFNTSGSPATGTLPGSPSDGDVCPVRRRGADLITIARNGKLIDNTAADDTLAADGDAKDYRYDAGTGSWWVY